MDENYALFDLREILVDQVPIIVDRVRQFSAQSTPLEWAREQNPWIGFRFKDNVS